MRSAKAERSLFSTRFKFRVMRLALLAVMSLHSKRYNMIAPY